MEGSLRCFKIDDTQSKNVVFISQCSRYDSMLQMKNGQRNDYINWVLTGMIEYLAYQMVVDKSSASVDPKVEAKNLFNATKDDKKNLVWWEWDSKARLSNPE